LLKLAAKREGAISRFICLKYLITMVKLVKQM